MRVLPAAVAACLACAEACAFEVEQVFREERVKRGNVNRRILQPADEADWIWIDDAGPTAGEIDAVRFVRRFTASGDPLVLDVSADQRFVLYLDGREIARGPHKGAVNHWYYQTYSVSGLEEGEHSLEAVVYCMGRSAPTAVLTYGKCGLLVKASGAYDAMLTTGTAAWRAARIHGISMGGFRDGFWFTVAEESLSVGAGLLDPMAADSALSGVKTVRERIVDHNGGMSKPGWALFPTERPDQMMAERHVGEFKAGQPLYMAPTNVYYTLADTSYAPVKDMNRLLKEGRPMTIPAGTKMRFVWNLGDYYCGYPLLEASGGAGAEIRWAWAESLYDRDDMRADRDAFAQKHCIHAIRDIFRLDGRERASFTTPWWRCGRWCEFEVKTGDTPLVLTKLAFAEVRYPLDCRATFECDDESIPGVWQLCRRGVENCMHETYVDCPFFEQQMYPGDTRVVMLVVDALSGDPRLTRFSAGLFDFARREDGLVPMNYPCRSMQDSSTYSLCWVMMLGDYVRWQGADSWLKARLPGMRHTLSMLLGCANEDGLLEDLPGWSFQDWASGWPRMGVAPDGLRGLSAVNNLLAVHALGFAADVEEAAGEPEMAAYWRLRKKKLAEKTLSRFWNEKRGLVADTVAGDRFSEHAQCLALLSDILPPERERRVLAGLLADSDLVRTTVYFSHYLFDVYVKFGRTDILLKRLDLWRGYVKTGLKTPLESPAAKARSDCHAWGSHPIYHLLTGIAGITPASNGFRSARIAPQPGGLKKIKATMPTPKGMISLDLDFADGTPKGKVALPAGLPGVFEWKGKSRPLEPGVAAGIGATP